MSEARFRKAQIASAIKQPPGTISAITAYGPTSRIEAATRIDPATYADKFKVRNNIALSFQFFRDSCISLRLSHRYIPRAEWFVNSRGRRRATTPQRLQRHTAGATLALWCKEFSGAVEDRRDFFAEFAVPARSYEHERRARSR